MFLIQLFGYSTLLNSQLGGFYCNYVPGTDDDEVFRNLRTNYFKRHLFDSDIPVDTSGFDAPFQLFRDDVKTAGYAIPDQFWENALSQAVPRRYYGFSILLALGERPTLEHLNRRCDFINGPSRASHSVRTTLCRLSRIESAFDPVAAADISKSFPFLNLCPIPDFDDITKAIAMLRSYLQTVQPLVIVSFGGKAANVLKHNLNPTVTSFASIRNYPSLGCIAGSATLQKFGPSDEEVFVHIPIIHPGSLNYGQHNLPRMRLFYVSMQYAIFLSSCAMDVVKKHAVKGLVMSRKSLCLGILEEANSVQKSTYGLAFVSNIAQAAHDFSSHCRLLRTGYNNNRSWLNNMDAKIQNMKKEGKDIAQIQNFCAGQLEQRYQLETACSDISPQTPHHNSEFPSDGANNSQRGNVVHLEEKQQLEIHERRLIHAATGRRLYQIFADEWRSAAEIDGIQVKLNPAKANFIIRWKHSNGKNISLRLVAPTIAIPQDQNEVRTIAFTKQGIDINGSDGSAFRPERNGVKAAASIAKSHFLSTEPGQILVDLWEAVMIAKGEDLNTPSSPMYKDWGIIRGIDRVRARCKTEKPRQNRPPDPLDANYLLNEFLVKHFPHGGIWCTAPKTKFPGSTEDTETFLAFLQEPEYITHPYADVWRSDLDPNKPRPDPLVLVANLKVLRETSHQRVMKWVPSLRKPVWFLNITIGPSCPKRILKTSNSLNCQNDNNNFTMERSPRFSDASEPVLRAEQLVGEPSSQQGTNQNITGQKRLLEDKVGDYGKKRSKHETEEI